MRKTRSDAVLLNLPEDQQAKLADWLLSGLPYHEARVLAEKEFGVALKSLDPFKEFWQQVCVPHLLERRRRSLQTAEERAQAAVVKPGAGTFDRATMDALQQRAYELAESPGANPKDVKAVLMLLLKARDQDFEREKLALDLARYRRETCELFLKWAADQRAKEIASGTGTTNAEKIEQLGQLMFGESWSDLEKAAPAA